MADETKTAVSVKLPDEYLPMAREFDKAKREVIAGLADLERQKLAMIETLDNRRKALQKKFEDACRAAQRALIMGGIISVQDTFVLDTQYLSVHHEAFVTVSEQGESTPPDADGSQRTIN